MVLRVRFLRNLLFDLDEAECPAPPLGGGALWGCDRGLPNLEGCDILNRFCFSAAALETGNRAGAFGP